MVDILPEHPSCRAFQGPHEMHYTICLCFNYYKNTPCIVHFKESLKCMIQDVSSPSSISLLGPVHLHHIMHFRGSLKCVILYMFKASDMITKNTYSNNRSWSIVAQGMFQLLDTSMAQSFSFPHQPHPSTRTTPTHKNVHPTNSTQIHATSISMVIWAPTTTLPPTSETIHGNTHAPQYVMPTTLPPIQWA